jgi:acetyl-CoA hydrolase
MMSPRKVLVGEGSAEPTSGFGQIIEYFKNDRIEFYFGVRRSPEGLEALNTPEIGVVANFPGRGMKRLTRSPALCSLSAYNISRIIDSGRLKPDAMLVVASAPDALGRRSLGTANGPLQSAIDHAPLIFVEEWRDLPIIRGAATIPADKKVIVLPHQPAAFAPLSRPPEDLDFACAENIASLLRDDLPLQIGVGGIIEALGIFLEKKRNLRIITGAVGTTIKQLHQAGTLDNNHDILGTALVGDDELVKWATSTPNLRLMPSRQIHNPRWLAQIPGFHSINIGLSIDLQGNVNAESVGEKRVSGKGGSPDFARGSYLSHGGQAIVALRTDRGNCLVDRIVKPTIPGSQLSYIVTEKGIVDLREKNQQDLAAIIERLIES